MDTERIRHDSPCCDETERPHFHVGEDESGRSFFRVGGLEVRGGMLEDVLAEMERWLSEQTET